MKKLSFVCIFLVFCSCTEKTSWLDKEVAIQSNSSSLDQFHILQGPEKVGHWDWEMTEHDNKLIFRDESVMDGVINENFVLTFNRIEGFTEAVDMSAQMGPVSQKVDFTRSSAMDLKGTFEIKGLGEGRDRIKVIDTVFGQPTVVRAEVFGMLPYVKNPETLNEELNVFFMNTATTGTMKLEYVEQQEIEIGTAKHNVHKIEFHGNGPVSNTIYISTDFPHKIMKVEVLNQPLTIERIADNNAS
ncbi:hypothetical protein M3P19_04040 [Muricauda sp. 2012CJ35-5]|uniref:Lipid/polyisoprenoid-binding YceI-like domain-containing protein n=1 Tax=Flagellimonas spongiicola TaxID=2942208 RepID=A0ABT0PP56_9FLAO|nr:hypothetical protein [Allomuricauda spongiicola]MCL6273164.1 hypothetical protein [Allomuricauda spongiicola]